MFSRGQKALKAADKIYDGERKNYNLPKQLPL